MFHVAMSPIIADRMCIVHLGGNGNGQICAYDLNTGDEIWQGTIEAPEYSSPVLLTVDGSKQIVTFTKESIVGIDVTDGRILWKLPFSAQRG